MRTPQPPVIDGRLDDASWQLAPVATDFLQRDPADGEPASNRTEVRVLYDNQAIYVGARLHADGSIRTRLGRRDMPLSSSDWFRVSFDSFRDRRNAVRFDVNPSGVRRDATISGDYFRGGGGGGGGGGSSFAGTDGELAWDPVWGARTTEDENGWTVEMRIPLSQIRFASADVQT